MHFTLRQIAHIIEGSVEGDPEMVITGVASLENAQEGDLSFARDEKYFQKARDSHASAFILPAPVPGIEKPAIIVANPFLAFGRFLHLVSREQQKQPPGVHSTAVIGEGATFGADVSVGPNATIGSKVTIGDRVTIYANAYIGDRTRIGNDGVVHANVCIREDVTIGKRAIIHLGAAIGADGFGFIQHGGQHIKIPQVGNVSIGDDVEIGAQTTIDRSALDTTVIGNGVKIDNHCHVAHNVIIGDNSMLIAYVKISGGVKIGRNVMMAGDCLIADNVSIGDGAVLAAATGVIDDIEPGARIWGRPSKPIADERRLQVILRQLPSMWPKLMRLLKEMEAEPPHSTDRSPTPGNGKL